MDHINRVVSRRVGNVRLDGMMDYKAAKESFHAGNLGGSIWSINVVSLVALSSYLLYGAVSHHKKPGPVTDYATMALPILLAVTVFASRTLAINTALVVVAGALFATSRPATQPIESGTGDNHPRRRQERTKGQWLDESDSDEEPAEPAPRSATLSIPLSQPISASSSGVSIGSSPTVPLPTALLPESPIIDQKARKRRHSPTPSTHTHMAIDILPTPELVSNGALSSQQSAYPSPLAARMKQLSGRLPFLSVYRAHMMVMTIHCILAVDFAIFPRVQGKCENFGTSLMDVGVGSFVFSMGVVAIKSFTTQPDQSAFRRIAASLYRSLPIILLGMVRIIMVKGSEYPEQVTEYGVHWNFFFTLAVLPVLVTVIWPIRRGFLRWSTIGLVITLAHEAALNQTGLLGWVLSEARVGLVGMNKEGIVSLPGYLAIFCLGLATGEHILRATAPFKPSSRVTETYEQQARSHYDKRRTELALELFGYSFGWWMATLAARLIGMQVSRRLANMSYVLWVTAFNTSFLFGYLALELSLFPIHSSDAVPPLLEAINTNGLAVFLVANVLTGLVNISIKTMYADARTSMLVLVGYSIAVCGIAWLVRGRRLKLG